MASRTEGQTMEGGEAGRLLIYTHADDRYAYLRIGVSLADMIELSTALQRGFPDRLVGPADVEWLRAAAGDSLPLPPPPSAERDDDDTLDGLVLPELELFHQPLSKLSAPDEFIYLVLGWLGGTVSKHLAEQTVQVAADLVRRWMQERRRRTARGTQTAYILGPDGEVLKEVKVRPGPR